MSHSNNAGVEIKINELKTRVSSLQQQYTGFVRLCTEIIRNYRVKLTEELRNDKTTPRQTMHLIARYNEDLESNIAKATLAVRPESSASNKRGELLDGFKHQIFEIIENQTSEVQMKRLISEALSGIVEVCSLENIREETQSQAGMDLLKAEENCQSLNMVSRLTIRNKHLTHKMNKLNEKVVELKQRLSEKEQDLQGVSSQLNEILQKQKERKHNGTSHYPGTANRRAASMILGNSNSESPNLRSPKNSEIYASQEFFKLMQGKLDVLGNLLKMFTQNLLKNHISQKESTNSEIFMNKFEITKDTKESNIDDIITPRFTLRTYEAQTEEEEKCIDQLNQKIDILSQEFNNSLLGKDNRDIDEAKIHSNDLIQEINMLNSVIVENRQRIKLLENENKKINLELKSHKRKRIDEDTYMSKRLQDTESSLDINNSILMLKPAIQ